MSYCSKCGNPVREAVGYKNIKMLPKNGKEIDKSLPLLTDLLKKHKIVFSIGNGGILVKASDNGVQKTQYLGLFIVEIPMRGWRIKSTGGLRLDIAVSSKLEVLETLEKLYEI